jgi:DNA-binding LytR/AlgR family response regulator
MIKIAICDDDALDLDTIEKILQKYISERKDFDITFESFNSSYDLISSIKEGKKYDIYLLDIIMVGIDGIDLGKEIRKYQEFTSIIYLSSSEEYALDSYKVTAMQYLIKPVDENLVFTTIDKAISQISSDENKLLIKTKNEFIAIPLHHIVYAEYSNHTINYHTYKKEIIKSSASRKPFCETIKSLLLDSRFMKCHNSFVINMKYICKLGVKDFITTEGSVIPISASLYVQAKNDYFNYLLTLNN